MQVDINAPCLRRYWSAGFRHNPLRDAPRFGFICLESPNQTLFVDPVTGNARVGRTVKVEH